MGRPKLSDAKKLSKRIIFRLTEDELSLLRSLADSSGKPAGAIVRQKLFIGKLPSPKIAKTDLQAYLELKKIGVNLNQLAKKANTGIIPIGLSKVITELRNQQEVIINLLLNDCQSENR